MKIERTESLTCEMTFDEVQDAVKAYLVKEGRCSKAAAVNLVIVGVEVNGESVAIGSKKAAVEKAAEAPSYQIPHLSRTIPDAAVLTGWLNAQEKNVTQLIFVSAKEVTIGGKLAQMPKDSDVTLFNRCATLPLKSVDGAIQLWQNGSTPLGAITEQVIVHDNMEVSTFLKTGEIPKRFRA